MQDRSHSDESPPITALLQRVISSIYIRDHVQCKDTAQLDIKASISRMREVYAAQYHIFNPNQPIREEENTGFSGTDAVERELSPSTFCSSRQGNGDSKGYRCFPACFAIGMGV
jgi:hypothetical protein